jgi:hypothetical protein
MLSRSAAAVTAHSRRSAAMRRLRRRSLDAHRILAPDTGPKRRNAAAAIVLSGDHGQPHPEPPIG